MSYQDMQNLGPGKKEGLAVFLLILWLAAVSIYGAALAGERVEPRQLEPLPSLETPPAYGPPSWLEFVHY